MSPKNQENEAHEPVNEQKSENGSEHHSGSEAGEDEPGKKNKYDRGGDHPVIGLIVYTILQFISLLFVVVATPIAMFTLNDTWRDQLYPALEGNSKKLCVTAWGMKLGCNTKRYYDRDFTHAFCYRVRLDFKVVEAFCIMTIGFMTFALAIGILSVLQKVSKGTSGAIGTFATIMCIIPWGVLAGMYHQKPCCETNNWNTDAKFTDCIGNNSNLRAAGIDVPDFKTMGKYGPGFGLLVAAWAVQVVAVIFAFVPL